MQPETVIGGRYRLDEIVGRGGMSEVWRAEDLELGRDVAIKLLGPDADRARFEREARAVASLAHPNITQVYDFGEWQGRPYMVLEFLSGGSLEGRLDGKPLPDDETFAIMAGIAAGLAHAHARGVVHRDLKPANVLFDDDGRPKLADFGIARMVAGEGTLTEAGTVLGTAAYISPEQAMGEPATAASDVYSFGVILYRLLTGRLPFESNDAMQLVMLHRDATPPPIERFRGDAPPILESTALAALAKDPQERPRDGAALLMELGVPAGVTSTAAIRGEDVTGILPAAAPMPPADAFPPPPPPRSRTPVIAAVLLLLALGGGALAYAVTRASSSAPGTVATSTQSTKTHPTTSAVAATSAPTTTTAPTTPSRPTTTQATTHPATTTSAPPPTTAPTTTAQPPTTTAPPTTALPTTTIATTLTTP